MLDSSSSSSGFSYNLDSLEDFETVIASDFNEST